MLFVAPLLFGAGLAGFYARYSERMQGEGRAGFAQAFAGLGFLTVGLGIEEGIRISSFGFLILTLGLVVLGFAMLRTEPLPIWNFLPLAIGMLTLLNVIVAGYDFLRVAISVLFGLGWLVWGRLDPTGHPYPARGHTCQIAFYRPPTSGRPFGKLLCGEVSELAEGARLEIA